MTERYGGLARPVTPSLPDRSPSPASFTHLRPASAASHHPAQQHTLSFTPSARHALSASGFIASTYPSTYSRPTSAAAFRPVAESKQNDSYNHTGFTPQPPSHYHATAPTQSLRAASASYTRPTPYTQHTHSATPLTAAITSPYFANTLPESSFAPAQHSHSHSFLQPNSFPPRIRAPSASPTRSSSRNNFNHKRTAFSQKNFKEVALFSQMTQGYISATGAPDFELFEGHQDNNSNTTHSRTTLSPRPRNQPYASATGDPSDPLVSARTGVLSYLCCPDCKLFSLAKQVIAISDADLDELLKIGGGLIPTVRYLKYLEREKKRFFGYAELVPELQSVVEKEKQKKSKQNMLITGPVSEQPEESKEAVVADTSATADATSIAPTPSTPSAPSVPLSRPSRSATRPSSRRQLRAVTPNPSTARRAASRIPLAERITSSMRIRMEEIAKRKEEEQAKQRRMDRVLQSAAVQRANKMQGRVRQKNSLRIQKAQREEQEKEENEQQRKERQAKQREELERLKAKQLEYVARKAEQLKHHRDQQRNLRSKVWLDHSPSSRSPSRPASAAPTLTPLSPPTKRPARSVSQPPRPASAAVVRSTPAPKRKEASTPTPTRSAPKAQRPATAARTPAKPVPVKPASKPSKTEPAATSHRNTSPAKPSAAPTPKPAAEVGAAGQSVASPPISPRPVAVNVEPNIPAISEGSLFTCYNTTEAATSSIFMWYDIADEVLGSLYFCSAENNSEPVDKLKSTAQSISVKQVRDIFLGHSFMNSVAAGGGASAAKAAAMSNPFPSTADSALCFSIVSRSTALHLQATSLTQRSLWINSIRSIFANAGKKVQEGQSGMKVNRTASMAGAEGTAQLNAAVKAATAAVPALVQLASDPAPAPSAQPSRAAAEVAVPSEPAATAPPPVPARQTSTVASPPMSPASVNRQPTILSTSIADAVAEAAKRATLNATAFAGAVSSPPPVPERPPLLQTAPSLSSPTAAAGPSTPPSLTTPSFKADDFNFDDPMIPSPKSRSRIAPPAAATAAGAAAPAAPKTPASRSRKSKSRKSELDLSVSGLGDDFADLDFPE